MVTVIPLPVKSKEASAHAEEFFAVRKKDTAGEIRESPDRAGPDRGTKPVRGEDEGFAAALGRAAAKTDAQRGADNNVSDGIENTNSGRGRTEAETVQTKFGRMRLKASGQGCMRPAGIRDTEKAADGESAAGERAKKKNVPLPGKKTARLRFRTGRSSAKRADTDGSTRVRTVLSYRLVRPSDAVVRRTVKETGEKSGARTQLKADRNAAARKALKQRIVVKEMKDSSRKGFKVDDRGMGAEESRPKPHTVKEFGRAHAIACERYETNLSRAEIAGDIRTFGTAGKSPDEIFGDIVRQFSFMVKKGGGEARLVLKPESLGELKLDIRLSNTQVNTHMVVETTALRDMIVSRLASLQDSLMSQGFSLGSFDVEVKDQNASNETGAKKSSARSGAVSGFEGEEPEAIEAAHRLALPWISTVVNITV
jgi:hypothetical protein